MLTPLRYRGYVYDQETNLYYLQSRYYDPEVGRFINADGLVATGQGFTGNNMFAYCGNSPVILYDPNGLYAVIKGRHLEGGTPTYYSDGNGRSDEVLELCKSQISIPEEYNDFRLSVRSLGRIYKKADRSLEYANSFLSTFITGAIGAVYAPTGIAFGILSFAADIYEVDKQEVFPDGYYDTYSITMTWTEKYQWEGGVTYTYASYEFLICWDEQSYPEPVWQLYTSQNNSYSVVIYD